MPPSVKEARSCPCKLLPRSLSSFTAAEYGDVHSLSKIKDIRTRRDDAGYNPLHFTAQFNHVVATAFLLELGCPVDGGGHCGATPLHRAAFSGATGAMKVLLDWKRSDTASSKHNRCDLLAKDTSFGDESTPLHKAAAGGRYLAVHMILEALKERDGSSTPVSEEPWLQRGLRARDKYGRTPLEVAHHLDAIRDTERDAVARWDAIAGGLPHWEKCAKLLRNAGSEYRPTKPAGETKQRLPRLPMHLSRGVMACLDCVPGDDGSLVCSTIRWQTSFQKALGDAAGMCILASPTANDNPNDIATVPARSTATNGGGAKQPPQEDDTTAKSVPMKEASTTNKRADGDSLSKKNVSIGPLCNKCRTPTVAFYPLPGSGILVCKRCRRLGT